jgi:hypothetical protein
MVRPVTEVPPSRCIVFHKEMVQVNRFPGKLLLQYALSREIQIIRLRIARYRVKPKCRLFSSLPGQRLTILPNPNPKQQSVPWKGQGGEPKGQDS